MDRNALVLYLETVRDLEVIQHRLKQIRNDEYNAHSRFINNHPTEAEAPKKFNNESEVSSATGSGIAAIALIMLTIFLLRVTYLDWFTDNTTALGNVLGILVLMEPFIPLATGYIAFLMCGLTFTSISTIKNNTRKEKAEEERYRRDLVTASNNRQAVAQRTQEYNKKYNYYSSELNKTNAILSKFYAMNLIPVQYRKLSAVCFLYDYMSTSQESYQMALLSNHIEDGIRRIEAKLDEIIYRLDDIIWQQKVIRDENRNSINRQIDQNNQMIARLKKMENSQRNIEEYSRLSANYNEAQTLISMADYLKNRR